MTIILKKKPGTWSEQQAPKDPPCLCFASPVIMDGVGKVAPLKIALHVNMDNSSPNKCFFQLCFPWCSVVIVRWAEAEKTTRIKKRLLDS